MYFLLLHSYANSYSTATVLTFSHVPPIRSRSLTFQQKHRHYAYEYPARFRLEPMLMPLKISSGWFLVNLSEVRIRSH